MISVENALKSCIENTDLGIIEAINLQDINGGFTAENIISGINLPGFKNSAMDGYALLYSDYKKGVRKFKVIGEIQAGDTNKYNLIEGNAYRIFTGAPIPLNCDLVVMQEHVLSKENEIILEEENSKPNQNIRNIGEQVKVDELALHKGSFLGSATIGYLASIGQSTINTISTPSVAVISTGNELVEQKKELKFGQIYESNSFGIVSQLKLWGVKNIVTSKLKDDYQDTLNRINEHLDTQDYLILTGGISVGDYDFVGKALKELGVKEIFYKVKQKPGKPIFFGRKGRCHIFALPGNPAAAISCLHIYVKTSLRKFRGAKDPTIEFVSLKAGNSFTKKGNRAQFLKAKLNNDSVTILEGQSSNMMQTFAVANVLVYLDENNPEIKAGDLVKSLLI
jgi:molybdopterin molybdotransferase